VPDDRVAIVASERGPAGARLVAIDEHGDRRHVLIAEATTIVRDTNPAVSPDGHWIVFASSRGRTLEETSLWIAKVGVEVAPQRLTDGAWIDSHPTWTRDGRAIVFASTRAAGNFDLWRVPIADGRAGEPMRLTSAPGHEVTPTVARDGTVIYAEVTPDQSGVEAHLEERAPDGAITRLTDGPSDTTPALSPDDATIAFSRAGAHDGHVSTDLWRLDRASHATELLIDLPPTDESGPVWSRDGRFLFATSALRGEHAPLFSSVIYIELSEHPAVARMLEDHAGGIVRLTPAIVAPVLDADALRRDPEYLPELARVMSQIVDRAKDRQAP